VGARQVGDVGGCVVSLTTVAAPFNNAVVVVVYCIAIVLQTGRGVKGHFCAPNKLLLLLLQLMLLILLLLLLLVLLVLLVL